MATNKGSFWQAQSSSLEPIRKFRFLFEMEGLDSYMVKSVSRPVLLKRPFIDRCEPIKLTIYDLVPPQPSELEPLTRASGHEQAMRLYNSKRRDATIKQLDPCGLVVEEWKLYKVKCTKIDFGPLDYASKDLCTITLTLEYKGFKYLT